MNSTQENINNSTLSDANNILRQHDDVDSNDKATAPALSTPRQSYSEKNRVSFGEDEICSDAISDLTSSPTSLTVTPINSPDDNKNNVGNTTHGHEEEEVDENDISHYEVIVNEHDQQIIRRVSLPEKQEEQKENEPTSSSLERKDGSRKYKYATVTMTGEVQTMSIFHKNKNQKRLSDIILADGSSMVYWGFHDQST